MTKDEALDKALNALLWANIEINDWRDDAHGYKPEDQPQIMEAITAIKQALAAQQEHEPENEPHVSLASVQEPEIVQRVKRYAGQTMRTARNPNITARECIELANWLATNTTPPTAQRQWVGLTDEDFIELCEEASNFGTGGLIRHIEAKVFEKNGAIGVVMPDALNPKDENPAYAAGWNDCRAEMLKGMKP